MAAGWFLPVPLRGLRLYSAFGSTILDACFPLQCACNLMQSATLTSCLALARSSLTRSLCATCALIPCRSNVVDQFLRVRAIPKVGEKGFFSSPTQIISASVVGGVTLNHLSWGASFGVPTAGLFLQGKVRFTCTTRCPFVLLFSCSALWRSVCREFGVTFHTLKTRHVLFTA